jgi:hypothetical protein
MDDIQQMQGRNYIYVLNIFGRFIMLQRKEGRDGSKYERMSAMWIRLHGFL